MRVEDAYRRCEAITAAEARNFSYGIRLLPGPKRKAMSALYALARRIDDIGDGKGAPPDRLAALQALRKEVSAIATKGSACGRAADDPVLVAVADTAQRYPLPLSAFDELIEGCEMDLAGMRYETFADLVAYCRRVAGTVGRLSLAVYGSTDMDAATPLADDLGVALQVTNILRDVVEDRRDMGRIYLPLDDLRRFGVSDDLDGDPDDLAAVISLQASRAEEWYGEGLKLLPLLDRRSRACTAAMAGIYHRILLAIRRDPAVVLSQRVTLSTKQKIGVATRALALGQARR